MSKLSHDLLREIERRGLKPRPVIYFLARRYVVWALCAAFVLFGALSAAFGIFAVTDLIETGGEAFDNMPFDDAAMMTPLIALALFLGFAASATLSFRLTKDGHRAAPLAVIGSALGLSLLLGLALHVYDAGQSLNDWLRRHWPAYQTYTHIPYEEWSHPEQGRLGGTAQAMNGETLILRDFHGHVWRVDMTGAVISFEGSPIDEGDVAITGLQTGPDSFRARAVDPFD